ncbi:hypothetical protein SAMN03159495_3416 [Pseudomonas sp. NFR16]|nr:hypothetical protein SAMN03159495_3416 [Pseudomonas sp. NFR16]
MDRGITIVAKPKAALKTAGLPIGLPDQVYATWVSSMSDILTTDNARHAAERYQFLCGFSQALIDAKILDDADYASMREKLLEAWTKTVNRVDQASESSI